MLKKKSQLNVEICCLHTTISNESKHTEQLIVEYMVKDSLLSLKLQQLCHPCVAVNTIYLSCLTDLENLLGYIEYLEIGTQLREVRQI